MNATPTTHTSAATINTAESISSTLDSRARFARLPESPINTSPVPRLTSLYHHEDGREYGDRRYPGNCAGALIRDLILYFRPSNVFDPMTGSGTCGQVCNALRVPCVSGDIHRGFDAADPNQVRAIAEANTRSGTFDFIWAHPPYWRQKLYSDNPNDLSRTPTLEAFLTGYGSFINAMKSVLAPKGKLAILMGDYTDRQAGFIPLTFHTKRLAIDAGLRQSCTDIIRFSHGNSSSKKVYLSSFIPGLHDVCMVFERA